MTRTARSTTLLLALALAFGLAACDDGGDGDGAGGSGGAPMADGGPGGMGGMAGTGGVGGMGGTGGTGGTGGVGGGTPPTPEGAVTVDVSTVWPAGTALRNAYTGEQATVGDDGAVAFDNPEGGVVLIEAADTDPERWAFDWDNATLYFAMTDRFANGDPRNDGSYGRRPDGADEVGTWHGGDWQGLIDRMDYLDALGVSAIWISAPYEQIHGWVGGGDGDFKHYAYHGYWALDFTRPDANWGDEATLRALVAAAHQRGIRVVLDVVMNHPGYAALDDLAAYLPEVLLPGWEEWQDREQADSWHGWNDVVNYESEEWLNWWGNRWIRAGFPLHNGAGMDDLRMSLAFLPDFMTEDFRPVPADPGLPGLLVRKGDSDAVFVDGWKVRNYLVSWLSGWVREYGVDGFRCDTAKHVEKDAWAALKDASTEALREWRAANPERAFDDEFWMVGEVFPHSVVRDDYFDNGFDSLINFDFQDEAQRLATDLDALDGTYQTYADAINSDSSFNALTYISSHDTSLFYHTTGYDRALQNRVGTALLLAPGGVQIFYGDESGRRGGPESSDEVQYTRSDMNWDSLDDGILDHWRALGTFRRRHPAVGAGAHQPLAAEGAYVFARTLDRPEGRDAVVVAIPR